MTDDWHLGWLLLLLLWLLLWLLHDPRMLGTLMRGQTEVLVHTPAQSNQPNTPDQGWKTAVAP